MNRKKSHPKVQPWNTVRDRTLLELLRERTDRISITTEASASALTNSDSTVKSACSTVEKQEFEDIKCLADLLELRLQVKQRLRRRRWPLICAVTSVILVGSTLLLLHTSSTQIEFEGRVRSMRFEVATEGSVFQLPTLGRVGISGVRTIQIPRTDTPGWDLMESPERAQLSTGLNGKLTLNSFVLPAHTVVELEAGADGDWIAEFSPPANTPIVLAMSAQGDIAFEIDSETNTFRETRTARIPRRVAIQSSGVLRLDLTPLARGGLFLRRELSVVDISFTHVEEYPDSMDSSPRQDSSILSGNIYLESLNGKTVPLRTSEHVSFISPRGVLRSVGQVPETQLRTDAQGNLVSVSSSPSFNVQFEGEVGGISIGPSGIHHTLMPTLLEWMASRQGLILLWGSIASIVGILVALLKWLEIEQ